MASSVWPSVWVLFISSVVVLIAACVDFDDFPNKKPDGSHSGEIIYAVVVSSVSSTLLLPVLLLSGSGKGGLLDASTEAGGKKVSAGSVVAGFFALWWIVGTCVLTFRGPYQALGNGYFGAWAALAGALAWFMSYTGTPEVGGARGLIMGLFVSSMVVLIAAARAKEDGVPEDDEGATNFAIALGAISILIAVAAFLFWPLKPILAKISTGLTVILWIVGAGVLTFKAPFTVAGNGYFGSWAGLIFAFGLTLDAFGLFSLEGPEAAPEPKVTTVK